jgi:Uma2 family endonuclease
MKPEIGMSTAGFVSVEEYLDRTEKPYCEYIDGVLYPKAMPNVPHARIQYLLLMLLQRQGIEALAEVTVRLSATEYLIPDVIAARTLQSPYPTDPVLLCIEILSPTDRIGEMLAKCEQYHSWGVPFCWVIDPDKQSARQHHAGLEPERVGQSGVLHAGELNVELDELFAEQPR